MKKKFIVEVDIGKPLWDMYNQYSCNQINLKFKNSYIRKNNNSSGINHDIWIPKTMKNGLIK